MKRLFLFLIPAALFFSCSTTGINKGITDTATIDGHPAWIIRGNIYEVNTRQYTPEGTFEAFSRHLPRLKEMGVQTLWFMPIHPISEKERKGKLGSYYAIRDYRGINPEHGTLQDWKNLVNQAHEMGFKVIIDWVPNHTGADHPWLTNHPDFYVRDSATGEAVSPYDWTDVKKLDFSNPQVTDSMIAAMKFWVNETGIDGFRLDHATGPGRAFWEKALPELNKNKKLLMLAEAEDEWLYDAGFDMSYAWKFFHKTKEVAAGKAPAHALDTILHEQNQTFPANALFLYFTSNHDENSWNLADWITMPGESHAPFAVLSQTIDKSVPLIYSGQEEPHLDSLRFFFKDTIEFRHFKRAPFYKTLLSLRNRNEALAANASFKKLATSNDAAIYAFEREKNGQRVLVVLNLSNKPQNFTFNTQPTAARWMNVFENKIEPVGNSMSLAAWGYKVYEKK